MYGPFFSDLLILYYQETFLTPGISPTSALSRKQIRHNPNRRMYPRDLPQS